MTSVREFEFNDLFKFNHINDPNVAIYNLSFYVNKLVESPESNLVAIAPNGRIMGYMLGEHDDGNEEDERLSYGHVSVLGVAHEYRRLRLATRLLQLFKEYLEIRGAWYMRLYVRQRNHTAQKLYKSLGFIKYDRFLFYYSNDNGYEMRLPLNRDVEGKSLEGTLANSLLFFARSILFLPYFLWNGLKKWILSICIKLYKRYASMENSYAIT